MIKTLKKNLKINTFTVEVAKKILPLIKEHDEEIVNSVVTDLLSDNEVVNTLNKNKTNLSTIKAALKYRLKLVFSGTYDKEYYEKIYKIGCTHVDTGVEAHIVMETVALFMDNVIHTVIKYKEIPGDEALEIINSLILQ